MTSRAVDDCDETEAAAVRGGRCPDCEAPMHPRAGITFTIKGGLHGGETYTPTDWHCTSATCGSEFSDMAVLGVARVSDPMPHRRARA